MNDKIIIKRSYSQKKSSNKNRRRSSTPNFYFDNNYYLMSIKDYKVERIMIKEYNKFFSDFYTKKKIV